MPDFERPPIDEVAIGFQLAEPIAGFVDAHAGVFWGRVRERYPNADSQPRIEAIVDPLGPPKPSTPQSLTFPLQQVSGGRTFLLSEHGDYLLQIQNNRFFRNWRRREDEYPHFDDLASSFLSDWSLFQAFLEDEKLQVQPISLFEVTYINWITDMTVGSVLRSAAAAQLDTEGLAHEAENQSSQAIYPFDESGSPVGRLTVQSAPAARVAPAGFEQGLQLALTFSAPGAPTVDESIVATLLTAARRCIVRSFADLTTAEAQAHWGRVQ